MNNYIVILLTKTPFDSKLTADAHNVILSTSAFFDEVKVIFSTEEAYCQLYKQNNTNSFGYKNILKSIKSFQWYDIESLYALEHMGDINTDSSMLTIISKDIARQYIQGSAYCFVY